METFEEKVKRAVEFADNIGRPSYLAMKEVNKLPQKTRLEKDLVKAKREQIQNQFHKDFLESLKQIPTKP